MLICWIRENCIRLWGWIVYELGYTECVGATLRFMWTATTYEVSVVYGILKISQRRGHTRPGCLAGGSRTTYSAAGCDKLRYIVETEGMTWAERILRPEAGMVLHHTVTEQAHDRWLTLRQRSTHKAYDKTALIEREEPEWQQTKTYSRGLSDELWAYILDLVGAGDEEPQDRPSAPDTDGPQTYGYVQIPLDDYDELSLRARRFTIRLPRDRALAILVEFDDAVTRMWTEMVCGPRASMVIHQIMMEANACLPGTRNQRRGSQHRTVQWVSWIAAACQGCCRWNNTLATCYTLDIVLESLDEFSRFFHDMYLYKSI